MTYSVFDHLQACPELATRENLAKVEAIWENQLNKRANIQALVALANEFKVPNHEKVRASQFNLFNFFDNMRSPLRHACELKERRIEPGIVVKLETGAERVVEKIHKTFFVRLEGEKGQFAPERLERV